MQQMNIFHHERFGFRKAGMQPARRNRSMARLLALVLVLTLSLASVLLLAGCGGAATTAATTTTSGAGTTAATTEQVFTAAELAAFDGKNGNKAYIAVDGIVYDVTALAAWGAKLHAGKFQAGKDYSAEIKDAPHGVDKLLTAVKIGVLKG